MIYEICFPEQVLQVALVGGAIYLAHLDRLKNVVGNRYKSIHLGGKVYIITGSNTGIGERLVICVKVCWC